MKRNSTSQRGAALIELMMSTTVFLITGSIVYYILNTGLILFAKNTAINSAHQQARVAVLQMEQELHSAVSIPKLVNADKTAYTGTDSAAGISFQLFAQGPFKISATAAASQKEVWVQVKGYTPKVGQRLCIPTHGIEYDISAVGAVADTCKITVDTNLPVAVKTELYDPITGGNEPVNVACFITDRMYYIVKNGELRYFGPKVPDEGRVLANNITTEAPFSIPLTPLGSDDNRFVAAINLSTADSSTSRRGFKAANMFLNAMVPCRARLCDKQ